MKLLALILTMILSSVVHANDFNLGNSIAPIQVDYAKGKITDRLGHLVSEAIERDIIVYADGLDDHVNDVELLDIYKKVQSLNNGHQAAQLIRNYNSQNNNPEVVNQALNGVFGGPIFFLNGKCCVCGTSCGD